MEQQQPDDTDDVTPPPESEEFRNWLELPPEVTATILHKVGAFDILNHAQKVCTSWLHICKDPSMWRSIDIHDSNAYGDYWFDTEGMARHAVDRSCGQLLEINIEYFGTDEFIHYLALNASKLRRLRLVSCHYVTEDVLKDTAAKFPYLEELEVQSTPFSTAAVEAVGRNCPRMKSLKSNALGYSPLQAQHDDVAVVIAETMPQLCHLQLIGNKMTNDGLEVILNGCLCLESLDLRGSYVLDQEADNIIKICSERIKTVRFPNEPIGEDEFRGKGMEHDQYSYGSLDSYSFDYLDHFEVEEPFDFDDGDLFFHEDDDLFDEEEEEWPWM
uniref:F-box domain-containing protein n=1 Tax=Kalanchoe fedtschenkoi TaxID=63787 RepID=A0A7N0RE84_KALFE